MKQINYILTFTAMLLFSQLSFAQKTISEATITYDIVISTSNNTASAANLMDGAVSAVYLKGNSSVTEMISSLGTQSTVVDGKTNNVTVVNSFGDQKYMIKYKAEDWKKANKKYDGITFKYENEYKTIAGYNCQKAIGTLGDGSTFVVFFTKELVPSNKDFQYLNKNLPGLAMQYEAEQGKQKVTYTVSKINFSVVPQSKFELPQSGYRVMNYEETMKK